MSRSERMKGKKSSGAKAETVSVRMTKVVKLVESGELSKNLIFGMLKFRMKKIWRKTTCKAIAL